MKLQNLLPESWASSRLSFAPFLPQEASHAQVIYNNHSYLKNLDPTFGEYELAEFQNLIEKNAKPIVGFDQGQFFLRKIVADNNIVGYLQLETDVPQTNQCWIPMLVLSPAFQGQGFGEEVVESLMVELRATRRLSSVGLNVYAQNIRAFRFWVKLGFDRIQYIEEESQFGRKYTCLTLSRDVI